MSDNKGRLIKNEYICQENLATKTRKWLNSIKAYSKKGERIEFAPSSSALLVIDMQNFFLSENSHAFIPSSKAIVPNIKELIAAYRERGLPVFFTSHSLKENEDPGIMGIWWSDVIREGDPLSEIALSMGLLASDIVVRKTRYNAFYSTDLEKHLVQMNIKSVVITGVMTHLCCETTAREAFSRDYEVFFVADATATQNEELHVSSLRAASHGFAVCVTANEILGKLKEM